MLGKKPWEGIWYRETRRLGNGVGEVVDIIQYSFFSWIVQRRSTSMAHNRR